MMIHSASNLSPIEVLVIICGGDQPFKVTKALSVKSPRIRKVAVNASHNINSLGPLGASSNDCNGHVDGQSELVGK